MDQRAWAVLLSIAFDSATNRVAWCMWAKTPMTLTISVFSLKRARITTKTYILSSSSGTLVAGLHSPAGTGQSRSARCAGWPGDQECARWCAGGGSAWCQPHARQSGTGSRWYWRTGPDQRARLAPVDALQRLTGPVEDVSHLVVPLVVLQRLANEAMHVSRQVLERIQMRAHLPDHPDELVALVEVTHHLIVRRQVDGVVLGPALAIGTDGLDHRRPGIRIVGVLDGPVALASTVLVGLLAPAVALFALLGGVVGRWPVPTHAVPVDVQAGHERTSGLNGPSVWRAASTASSPSAFRRQS